MSRENPRAMPWAIDFGAVGATERTHTVSEFREEEVSIPASLVCEEYEYEYEQEREYEYEREHEQEPSFHPMTFAHPLWLLCILLLPALVAVQVWSEVRRRDLLRKLVAIRLQPRLANTASRTKRWLRLFLLLAGLMFLFITLAQPRWGEVEMVEIVHGRDVILIVDTSRSMLADDLAPNRLTRVKLAAEDLIGELQNDRIGLVAFAGTAFLQAPLTADRSAVLASLHELDTTIIPRGGTNIAEALRTAVDAFGKGESEDRAIVLFTDGEELDDDSLKAAQELKGVRIFTVGAGSPDGRAVPLPQSQNGSPFLLDAEGHIVKSRLDEERLRAIAEAAGGFYVLLRSGPAEMKQVLAGLMQISAHDSENETSRRPIERYQWPLAAALLFLIGTLFLGERRRARPFQGALAGLFLLLLAVPGRASNPGLQRYGDKDYAGALQHFEEQLQKRPDSSAVQYDVGTAAYKAGQLERALEAFSQAIRAPDTKLRGQAEYNLGNTLFQRGSGQKERLPKIQDWRNSLQHYEEALRVMPKDADATYNREVVLKLLEEQETEQKKEDKKKQEEQKKEQEKKEQPKKEQEKKNGQKGDQKDQQDGQQGEGEQSRAGEGQRKKPGEKGRPKSQSKDGDGPEKEGGKGEEKEGQEGQEGEQKEEKQPKQGDIRSTEKGKEEQARQQAAEQAAEEQAAAEAGRMTAAQARSLLDSLKNEDDHIRLLNPKTKASPDRTIRDW